MLPILLCLLTPSSLIPSGLLVPVPPPQHDCVTPQPAQRPYYAPVPQDSCLK